MIKTYFFPVFILFLVPSCNNSCSEKYFSEQTSPIIVDIQPFNDVSDEYVNFIHSKLTKMYRFVELKRAIELPTSAYYSKHNRYRADSLLNFLKTITPKGHITLGLTTKDISHTKGVIKDYGIMGLGFKPGPSCIISAFRLSKTNIKDQYFKLAVHELGHTQGLAHCSDTTCYMRDCGGENHWDEEKDFCDNCKSFLAKKGWTF